MIPKTHKGTVDSGEDINEDDTKNMNSLLGKVLGEISKTSSTKQMIIGVTSGWVTGFLSMRIGKTTALALGGGIILLQVASEKGYIKINWNKINKNIDKASQQVEKAVHQQHSTCIDKVVKFAQQNTTFSSGFIGGFLIGLASQ